MLLNELRGGIGLINAEYIFTRLQALGDRQRAQALQRFFKTGPGEYGEGDVFVGIRVPEVRKLAKEYEGLPLYEAIKLLQSPVHEARMLALLVLTRSYNRGDAVRQKEIYEAYLQNTRYINSWDLVDLSAEHIVGAYLLLRDKAPLYALAESSLLWERRISILATFHYIKRGELEETLHIARTLLVDPEDLIHKAVGWMLREVGKRDHSVEEAFLKAHYKLMPRAMLRYAIEKFPEALRQQYLKGQI